MPISDSTIARMAGNIAAGMVAAGPLSDDEIIQIAKQSVELAIEIAGEVERIHGNTEGEDDVAEDTSQR